MAHAAESITIQRPVSTVFAFILDGTNNPRWCPAVVDIQHVSGSPDGVGARYKQSLSGPGGRRIAGDYEIVTCRPDREISFRVTAGPARPTGTYRFDAQGEATRVTFSLDYEPRGLARVMAPLIAGTMRREVATLANLKTYLEQKA